MKLFTSALNFQTSITGGGLFLSFDDIHTTSWLDYHNNYGASRGWKATFYTISPYPYQLDELIILHSLGHEIANHTGQHFNQPAEYMETHTALEYYNTYVKPLEDRYLAVGLPKTTSFRFPYARHNKIIESDLIDNRGYKSISPPFRGDFENIVTETNIFYNCDKRPIAKDIGIVGISTDFAPYKECLDFAKENNKVVCFFAHGITTIIGDFLTKLLDYAVEIGLNMYTASQLIDRDCTREIDLIPPIIGTLTMDSLTPSDVYVSCTATDNIKVVGWDIIENGLDIYSRYESVLSNQRLIVTSGLPYTFEVYAFDKYGNRSAKSNTLTFTAP